MEVNHDPVEEGVEVDPTVEGNLAVLRVYKAWVFAYCTVFHLINTGYQCRSKSVPTKIKLGVMKVGWLTFIVIIIMLLWQRHKPKTSRAIMMLLY